MEGGAPEQAVDDSDSWRFSYIVAIVTAMGVSIVMIFHFGTPEKNVELSNEESVYNITNKSQIRRSSAVGEENDEETTSHNVTVNMNWSDWFREKHFFYVRFFSRESLKF